MSAIAAHLSDSARQHRLLSPVVSFPREWSGNGAPCSVVCVAIFMLLLDITVVNVALPDIQQGAPHLLHRPPMGRRRVRAHARERRCSTPARSATCSAASGSSSVSIALFTARLRPLRRGALAALPDLARGAPGHRRRGMFAVSLAIISQEFHGRERGTAFGIWGATVGLAVAIGPLVGGALTDLARLALDLLRQHPDRDRVRRRRACAYLHESRNEEHGGFDLPGLRDADRRAVRARARAAARQRLGLVERARRRPLRRRGRAARRASCFDRAAPAGADARLPRSSACRPSPARRSSPSRSRPGCSRSSSSCRSTSQNVLGYSAVQAGVRLPAALAASRSSSRRSRDGSRRGSRCGSCSAAGSRSSASRCCSCTGSRSARPGRRSSPGFIVGGIGIGLVNAPLASTAVSVVEPRRAGMASGHQQHVPPGRDRDRHRRRSARSSRARSRRASPRRTARFVQPFQGDRVGRRLSMQGQATIERAHSAFISGLNTILLVAAFVAFAGAVLAFVLVRQQDFVASGAGSRSRAG